MYDLEKWRRDMQAAAIKKGLKPKDFCKLAGISVSVWYNMKRYQDAKISVLNRIESAIKGV